MASGRWTVLATMGLLWLISGCVSLRHDPQRGQAAYHLGDFVTAEKELSPIAGSRSRAAKAAQLDLALVQIAAGRSDQAMVQLRQLRDEFSEPSAAAPLATAASIVADDNLRVYRPAGYEQVMIRSLLALCSLTVGDGDAESYALQAQMYQASLATQAETRGLPGANEIYQPLVLAPYMRGVMRESTWHDYDDAVRAYQLVSHLEPRFAPAQGDIERCLAGVHSPPGHGVLYVFALVGRGPVLQPTDAEMTTAALEIASHLYAYQSADQLRLPNFVTVKVPQVVVPDSPAAAVSIDSSGVWLGATQSLVDIGAMAQQQCEAEMPWTIARAVVRRMTKEVAVTQASQAIGLSGIGRDLANFATVNTWSLTERADTRCWGLLPREIQVLRAELPVGSHRIGLSAVDGRGQPLGTIHHTTVDIHDGQNSYLTTIASDREAFVARAGK